MKILQINDGYERLGGAETYFFSLIELLRNNGHQVFTFAIKGKSKKAEGFFSHHFSGKVFNFKVYFKLKKFIERTSPDIIHIHNNYLAPFSVLLAVRGYKVFQTVHDYMLICPCGWMVNRKTLEPCHGKECFVNGCLSLHNSLISYIPFQLRKIATKRVVRTFFSPSRLLKKYLESFGFKNVHYLPYFLDVESFRFNRGFKKDGNILYIGRLAREKGVADLIKALPKIISKIDQADLTIVGDGPQRAELVSLAKELGVATKINFVGKVPHEKVRQYYQKANVVVIPSVWFDNSPNVVYEAFSSGRPVIASDRGGMSDFVKEGQSGFIFKSGDTKELATRIIMVLQNERLFKKLSSNCRKYSLLNFSPERHFREITKIYENVKT